MVSFPCFATKYMYTSLIYPLLVACFVCVILLDLAIPLNRLTYKFQYSHYQHSGIHSPYGLVIISVSKEPFICCHNKHGSFIILKACIPRASCDSCHAEDVKEVYCIIRWFTVNAVLVADKSVMNV